MGCSGTVRRYGHTDFSYSRRASSLGHNKQDRWLLLTPALQCLRSLVTRVGLDITMSNALALTENLSTRKVSSCLRHRYGPEHSAGKSCARSQEGAATS